MLGERVERESQSSGKGEVNRSTTSGPVLAFWGMVLALVTVTTFSNLSQVSAQDIPKPPLDIPVPSPPTLVDLKPLLEIDPELSGLLDSAANSLKLKVYQMDPTLKGLNVEELKSHEIKQIGSCTGFLLQPYESRDEVYLVTARHCIVNRSAARSGKLVMIAASELTIVRPDLSKFGPPMSKSKRYHADQFITPPFKDAAMVRVDPDEFPFTRVHRLSRSKVRIGDRAELTGYPGGLGPFNYECEVLGHRMGLLNSIQMTLSLVMNCPETAALKSIAGASGGPVLDEKGEVVGILGSVEAEAFELTLKTGNVVKGMAFNGLTYFADITSLEIIAETINLPLLDDGFHTLEYLHPQSRERMFVMGYIENQVLTDTYRLVSKNGGVEEDRTLKDGILVQSGRQSNIGYENGTTN